MPGLYTNGAIATDPGSILDYEAASNEVFDAGWARQFDTNPTAFIAREARFLAGSLDSIAGNAERVDQATAQKETAALGLDLKFPVGGVTRDEMEALQYLKQREVQQNVTTARSRGLVSGAAGFAGGLGASFVDPINVASGFIPIVGEVRYAQWLAAAGKGAFARGAVRAGAGALEGAVGAAIVEPIVYAGATQEQLDYGLMDSFLNVTLGGALGGGLHVLGGGFHDWAHLPVGAAIVRRAASDLPEYKQRELFQRAVAAAEIGTEFDAEASIRASHGTIEDDPLIPRFKELVRITGEAEKVSDPATWTDAEKAAYNKGSWREFSKLRGYTEKEMADYAEYQSIANKLIDKYGADTVHGFDLSLSRGDAIQSFTTAKGSTYQVHEDGTTSRNKAFRAEHGAAEQGAQPKSDATLYVTPDQASALATPTSNWRVFRHDDGTLSILTKNKDGQWGIAPSARNIPASTQPAAGLIPVELWKVDADIAGKKGAAYRTVHFGNEITEVRAAPGERAPDRRALSDIIPQARAESAGDRALIEAQDGTSRAPKVEPKDPIDRAKADEAYANDLVEEFRTEGRLTEEDEATLKAVDVAAKRAELKAKAFEAAAACMGAA